VFNIGDKVIHPAYGAGSITDIAEKQIGNKQRTYYIIELLTQAGTLMVPVSRADDLGLRPPVKTSKSVMKVLSSQPVELLGDHRKRQELISTSIRSGDVMKISEVVRDLAHRDRENSLTEADLRLYRQAQEFLAGELSLSLGTDVEAARGKIELALGVTGEDGIESLADQL
jgi:CarD family transcriptional regulator